LIAILHKLGQRIKAGQLVLDGIVIETTGMADPAPVAQTFLVDPFIRGFARLDGIVTLVDAKHVEQHLDDKKPEGVVNEAAAQVGFADRLLLNKTDLVAESDLKRVEARLRAINHFAPIHRSQHSKVSVEQVLNVHGFDLQRTLSSLPDFLDPDATPTQHDKSVTSVSLNQSAARHLRKGVLKGELDYELLQAWLQRLMNVQGADIFRMKGMLSIAHSEHKFVYHAVHMIFDGAFHERWDADEPRESKLVFIGKNLDAAALAASFNSCLATPENIATKTAALRFGVGNVVECCVGPNEWARGKVVKLWHREPKMPPGMVAPYQVQLDEDPPGEYIFAPVDDECVIRAQTTGISARLHDAVASTVTSAMSALGVIQPPPPPPEAPPAPPTHEHAH